MKNLLFLAMSLLLVSIFVSADEYQILDMNTPTIKIGHKICSKKDTFSDKSTIYWTKPGQAIKAKNLKTREIALFSERSHNTKESKSIVDYFIKPNKMSVRGSYLHLSNLADILPTTLYIFDSLKIESPICMDSTCFYYLDYYHEGKRIVNPLPNECDTIIIPRQIFSDSVNEEITANLFFKRIDIDKIFSVKDSIKLIILPISIKE